MQIHIYLCIFIYHKVQFVIFEKYWSVYSSIFQKLQICNYFRHNRDNIA